MHNIRLQRGFSILELTLVLTVVALLLTLTLRYYPFFAFERKLTITRNSVSMLLRAMSDYYYLDLCHAQQTPLPLQVTYRDLLAAGVITPNQLKLIENPFGNLYDLGYAQNDPPRIVIKATMVNLDANDANKVGQLLGADSASAQNTLLWTRMPQYTMPDNNNSFWVLRGYAKIFGNLPTEVSTVGGHQAACSG